MDRLRLRRSRIGRRKRVGWLSRIDGVEKPALLVGLGMVLFRVWKAGEPATADRDGRWRGTLRRWRQRLQSSLGLAGGAGDVHRAPGPAKEAGPATASGAIPRNKRPPHARAGNPPL